MNKLRKLFAAALIALSATLGACAPKTAEQKEVQTYAEAWKHIKLQDYCSNIHHADDYEYVLYVKSYSGPNEAKRCVVFVNHNENKVYIFYGIDDDNITEDYYVIDKM